jgi:hypothetical protein
LWTSIFSVMADVKLRILLFLKTVKQVDVKGVTSVR